MVQRIKTEVSDANSVWWLSVLSQPTTHLTRPESQLDSESDEDRNMECLGWILPNRGSIDKGALKLLENFGLKLVRRSS
jgi:hypothetical protein